MELDALLKVVDLVMILAVLGIAEGIKKFLPESSWRFMPLIVIVLGIVAGWLATDTSAPRAIMKGALLYAGAASIIYELGRTTLLGKSAKAEPPQRE